MSPDDQPCPVDQSCPADQSCPVDEHCGELHSHPFELRTTVEHAIAQFAGAAGELDLISHLAEDCPAMVVGDVVRLRQVLGHLVGNAVRFTAHGDVLLRVELDVADQRHPDQVRLRFTVADTGIGIPPERLDQLFQAGPGLGLAISKAIVEAMGGWIAVTSTPGGGSEFTFGVVLGRSGDPEAVPRPRVGTTELARLADRNVLVVVNDEGDRQILRRQLESYGMVCTASDSPLDAVDLVGGGRSFDIAILDGTTPTHIQAQDGVPTPGSVPMMDGVQLGMVLRRLPAGRRLPLVLLSGSERPDREPDALFAAVLTGPIGRVSVFPAITHILCPDPVSDPPFASRPSQPSQPSRSSQPSPSNPSSGPNPASVPNQVSRASPVSPAS